MNALPLLPLLLLRALPASAEVAPAVVAAPDAGEARVERVGFRPVGFTDEQLLLLEVMQGDPAVREEYRAERDRVNAAPQGAEGDRAQAEFMVRWTERLHAFSSAYLDGTPMAGLPKPEVAEARERLPWLAAIGAPEWNTGVFTNLVNAMTGVELQYILARMESMNDQPENPYRLEIARQLGGATGFAPAMVSAVMAGHIRNDMRAVFGQAVSASASRLQTARQQLEAVIANPDAGYDGNLSGEPAPPISVPDGAPAPTPFPSETVEAGQEPRVYPRIPTDVPPPDQAPEPSGGGPFGMKNLIGAGVGAAAGALLVGGLGGALIGAAVGFGAMMLFGGMFGG